MLKAPVVFSLTLLTMRGLADEPGLVAHWNFDEGDGNVLHDISGHGNHGTILGAEWVACGDGFALRFDGKDDRVNCGASESLNLTKAVTLEAWVFPEAIPPSGEAGIAGKDYGSYVLTLYRDGQCWWYISGGGNNLKTPLPRDAWHHVVGTFDGTTMRLYVDGELADAAPSKAKTISPGGSFLMGTSEGDPTFTQGVHFQGLIDEVRVYDRALSTEEIVHHYRTTHRTGELAIRPMLSYFQGEVRAELDLRGLGELPEGCLANVELSRAGEAALQKQTIALPTWGTAEVRLTAGDLAAGEYHMRVVVRGADGAMIGKPAACTIRWPQRPSWPDAPGTQVLNNLVTQLLDLAPAPGEREYPFTNPRDGWVFVRTRVAEATDGPVTVALNGEVLHTHQGAGTLEAMRWLPRGEHRVTVGTGGVQGLDVRAIPELGFAQFGAHPHVREYGLYDWEFLSKYVLPNLNLMIGGAGDPRELIAQWHAQGKKWLVHCGVPGIANAEVGPEQAERYWREHPGMTDPDLDGVIADEFYGGDGPQFTAWTEALRNIAGDPQYRGKSFYPYCGPMYGAAGSQGLIQVVMDAGWRFSYERYLPEQRSETAARAYLDRMLAQSIRDWEAAQPGALRHMVVNLGYMSQPPESLNVNPSMNYKVYLDLQLNVLANDPACFGLYGAMTYLSSYSDEETVRWASRLFRHYCIEGQAGMLSADPLMLRHVMNPDFEEGLAGWTVQAAEEGSVAARMYDGFSWLQGRYPPTSQGNTVLWMRRSAERPNRVSQRVVGLQPGRLYSVKMYSADYRDLSVKQKLGLSVNVTGAEILKERCFQHVFHNCYSHHFGPYTDTNKAWMNYHWVVFRATGPEAELSISDWASPEEPGGPVGQELAMNFVEVQPYDEP